MKWYRIVLAVVLLNLAGGCANPTAPRFPEEEPGDSNPKDPPKEGFIFMEQIGFWV